MRKAELQQFPLLKFCLWSETRTAAHTTFLKCLIGGNLVSTKEVLHPDKTTGYSRLQQIAKETMAHDRELRSWKWTRRGAYSNLEQMLKRTKHRITIES